MSYTANLDGYQMYDQTPSCYLDGRYFNKVFANYPGLIRSPLNIHVFRDRRSGELTHRSFMNESSVNNNYPGLLRVIINTPTGKHSSLLIIDYRERRVLRFDPHGTHSPYSHEVNLLIEDYLAPFLDFTMYHIDNPVSEEKTPNCDMSGFCVAYVIKFAYDYLNRRTYEPYEIRRFASMIEQTYGPLPEEGKDVEYGLFGNNNPDQGRNMAIGAIGGSLLGGALAGPTGLLVGAGAGGLLGAAL